MMMSYIQVFKVYHLSKANYRFKHEISNNTYTVFSYWFAELTTTAIMLSTFIPGTIIAYFMMGLPSKSFPFLILLFWMVSNCYVECNFFDNVHNFFIFDYRFFQLSSSSISPSLSSSSSSSLQLS